MFPSQSTCKCLYYSSTADQILSASLTTTYRPSETISIEDIKQEKKVVIRTEKDVEDEGVEKTKKIKKILGLGIASLKQFYKAKRLNVYKQKTPSLGGALLLIILFSF